jgi:CubicO group peptidase (beta-lactamase class C family)
MYSASYPYGDNRSYFSGGAGLVSTAEDYAAFCASMLLGELNGHRLLSPVTIDFMTRNHIGDLDVAYNSEGYGFGLGFAVLTDPKAANVIQSQGTYSWGGFFSTQFWVDPREEIIGISLTQKHPGGGMDLHSKFVNLTYQAIVKSWKK